MTTVPATEIDVAPGETARIEPPAAKVIGTLLGISTAIADAAPGFPTGLATQLPALGPSDRIVLEIVIASPPGIKEEPPTTKADSASAVYVLPANIKYGDPAGGGVTRAAGTAVGPELPLLEPESTFPDPPKAVGLPGPFPPPALGVTIAAGVTLPSGYPASHFVGVIVVVFVLVRAVTVTRVKGIV